MSSSVPQVFQSIAPSQFAKLIEKAHAAGIEISGNSGVASRFGVEIAWNYAPDTQQLTLQCLRAPFFVSAADIDAKIQTLVKDTLA